MHSRIPAAKGFVANSFFTGLTPTEFFFHTMGGREGLVDTAVKTADTGYMQRKLVKALEDLAVHYDDTVRNSVNGIVQFTYGDDGLDPAAMEATNKPVDIIRLLAQSRSQHPDVEKNHPSLMPKDIKETVEKTLNTGEFINATQVFKNEIRDFWRNFTKDLIAKRVMLGIPVTENTSNQDANLFEEIPKAIIEVADNLKRITAPQLEYFLQTAIRKYGRAKVEPATAVGAVGAQSIGEPATQMTLKTFHFAGVASMNVTLGVPRIKEIMGASKKISTPIITATLVVNDNLAVARIVQGRIQKTTLGQIAKYIKEVYDPAGTYLLIKLDWETINAFQLEITTESVKKSILEQKKLKLKEPDVRVDSNSIRINPKTKEKHDVLFSLLHLKNKIANTLVKGIPGVERAVINIMDNGKYNLLVEGNALPEVMAIPGIIGEQTQSNHIIAIQSALGIEAARRTIITEIANTMTGHGILIDTRHLTLLADVMTYKGEILGVNRFGICKIRDSVLALASFEKTTDILFEAAARGRIEPIVGISECIIMGRPIPIGTGLFKVLQRTTQYILPQRGLLLDSPDFTISMGKKLSK
eukprot:TRINITY_DN4718_c0_g1_i1.p1 TRINITY_DN4718_c0_g1~~TRINITY_DN4718_c0_g1_i1.p1  ORF type:complete len:585 (-),score=234.22 TRINITY_DN4718_c0_g1_i1:38-1792(-)